MAKMKGLYDASKYDQFNIKCDTTVHAESRKIVHELRKVQDAYFRDDGLTQGHYSILEKHLSVVLNMRDRELYEKYTNTYKNLCSAAKCFDGTALETALSKLIGCMELLPDDKARMIFGKIRDDDTA